MTTALTMITDSLMELGVLAEGDTPTAAQTDSALRTMNRILALFSNDQSFSPFANHETRALTGESSFTIGPTGGVATLQPIRIDTATVDRDGITYPVDVVDNQKWDSIVYKLAPGAMTKVVWYEATSPNGILHVWPISSGCTLNLRVINLVVTFANLSTVLTMPLGYEEAIMSMLAVRLSPQYPAGVLSPVTVQAAKAAMKLISNTNNVVPTMQMPSGLPGIGGGFSIGGFLGGH